MVTRFPCITAEGAQVPWVQHAREFENHCINSTNQDSFDDFNIKGGTPPGQKQSAPLRLRTDVTFQTDNVYVQSEGADPVTVSKKAQNTAVDSEINTTEKSVQTDEDKSQQLVCSSVALTDTRGQDSSSDLYWWSEEQFSYLDCVSADH